MEKIMWDLKLIKQPQQPDSRLNKSNENINLKK